MISTLANKYLYSASMYRMEVFRKRYCPFSISWRPNARVSVTLWDICRNRKIRFCDLAYIAAVSLKLLVFVPQRIKRLAYISACIFGRMGGSVFVSSFTDLLTDVSGASTSPFSSGWTTIHFFSTVCCFYGPLLSLGFKYFISLNRYCNVFLLSRSSLHLLSAGFVAHVAVQTAHSRSQ